MYRVISGFPGRHLLRSSILVMLVLSAKTRRDGSLLGLSTEMTRLIDHGRPRKKRVDVLRLRRITGEHYASQLGTRAHP